MPAASCNLQNQHYINSIEDGAEHGVQDGSGKREGTELWTYGLMIKPSLTVVVWFNTKPSDQNGLTLNYLPRNGLILNYLSKLV